ncbi:MAG: hypothetical protein SVR81_09590, partial [Chloroflexota bacterium]|nr:hypothetical protein [Chloroflexota bacterium]
VYEVELDLARLRGLEALIEAVDGQIPVGVMGRVKQPGDLDALREWGCSRIGVEVEQMTAFLEE